jgi:hypothetical protein
MREERSNPRRPEDPMSTLLLIIPSVWITTAAMVVVLCRGAARGDAALYERQRREPRSQYDDWAVEGSQAPCERRERRLSAAPVRDRDGRARGGRCAAGS